MHTGGALFIISFLAFSAGIIFWIIAYKFLKKSDIKSIDGVLPDFRRIKQLFYISLFLTVINTLALRVDAFMAAWS